ncbi:hypothetical protein BJ970_000839 [Saccharopolyspora phatthalungensis]|uniref:DUF2637 domain-containing protein n=1 Tax=Saccharopolyspora phatthalungensis TaxID=664693 RepID=A0A840Q4M1_9PSEU|nr:hypothetical protein [Saccharopolyspora phatthalungensis]
MVKAVTVIMGVVIGLTFMFGFGNVLNLALRLGVPVWVAPLVAPAVDLSILGLLLGSRHLALAGASVELLRPARRLLVFASVVTLALNVADPLVAGHYGKAAFDAVGPLLLIGWAEVGPDLLRALTTTNPSAEAARDHIELMQVPFVDESTGVVPTAPEPSEDEAKPDSAPADKQINPSAARMVDDDLLERAKKEDAHHWDAYRRPISADTLRKKLRIGAARARLLVAIIRADPQRRSAQVVG